MSLWPVQKYDDFGKKRYRLNHFAWIVYAGIFFLGYAGWANIIIGCNKPAVVNAGWEPNIDAMPEFEPDSPEWPDSAGIDNTERPEPEPELPQKQAERKVIVRYEYRIQKVFTKNLYATCYSQLDSPVEAKGIYANNKFDDFLHRQERRIQRYHYTVAINPELKQYHEALIELPGGIWTHKYRVHVPDYNKSKMPESPFKQGEKSYMDTADYNLLDVFNDPYWSVPRDRMRQKGRIDVLFTTAGNYYSIKKRQSVWARKNTHEWPCDFWEIQKIAVYSDGSERKVE